MAHGELDQEHKDDDHRERDKACACNAECGVFPAEKIAQGGEYRKDACRIKHDKNPLILLIYTLTL